MGKLTEAVSRVRRPEYTGTNRCTPCTALNLFIAVVVAGTLAVVAAPWVGIAGFAVFVGVVYLRGYLVPRTPTITRRYFPDRVLRLFGKESTLQSTVVADVTNTDETGFIGADRLRFSEDVLGRPASGGIELADEFRAEWHERIENVRNRGPKPADVEAIYDADTATGQTATSFVLDNSKLVQWDSKAALVADIAAMTLLRERGEWRTIETSDRTDALRGLRTLLDRCPSCGGSVLTSEERVEPCCEKPHVVVHSKCESCDSTVVDVATVATDGVSVQERLLRP